MLARLVMVVLVALWSAPAAAQDNRWGMLDKVAGKTFQSEKGALRWDRSGDQFVQSFFAQGPLSSVTTKVQIQLDGQAFWKDDPFARFAFYANGMVEDSKYFHNVYVLLPDGDVRLISKTKGPQAFYSDQLYARTDVGDAKLRAKLGSLAINKGSGAKYEAAMAAFDSYARDPATSLGGGAVQVAALLVAAGAAATGTVGTAAVSGPRHALIVANARYTPVLGSLPNPVNDGRLVAGALRAAGFQVEVVTDADQRTMKQAIARLGSRLAAAGKGATGLFYYAGHGVQARGVNYLLPVNAEPRTEADVDLDGVAADNVLKQMEDAGAATNIVILDACRDMPLARGSRTASRGLVRMEAPNGSYLAYSTAPGQTATDGGGANSPFATALAAEIARPNQPIEGVFRNVRRAVSTATGGKQTPWDASSLFDSFVFTAK